MAIKLIAQRQELKIGKNPGKKCFVMRPELYSPINEKKVFAEAATHSGISAGVIKAAWDAAGEVIRTWAIEDTENTQNQNQNGNQSGDDDEPGGSDHSHRPRSNLVHGGVTC